MFKGFIGFPKLLRSTYKVCYDYIIFRCKTENVSQHDRISKQDHSQEAGSLCNSNVGINHDSSAFIFLTLSIPKVVIGVSLFI